MPVFPMGYLIYFGRVNLLLNFVRTSPSKLNLSPPVWRREPQFPHKISLVTETKTTVPYDQAVGGPQAPDRADSHLDARWMPPCLSCGYPVARPLRCVPHREQCRRPYPTDPGYVRSHGLLRFRERFAEAACKFYVLQLPSFITRRCVCPKPFTVQISGS